MSEMSYQHFFGIAVFIMIVSLVSLLFIKNDKMHKNISISQNIAMFRSYTIIFAISTSVSVVLLLIYLQWLKSEYDLGDVFTLLFYIFLGTLLFQSLIPHVKGWKSKAHIILAYIMAVVMPILAVSIAMSINANSTVKIAALAFVIYAIILVLIRHFIKSSTRYFVFFQGSYLIAFICFMGLVTYAL